MHDNAHVLTQASMLRLPDVYMLDTGRFETEPSCFCSLQKHSPLRVASLRAAFVLSSPVVEDYGVGGAEDRDDALDVDDVLLRDDGDQSLVAGRQRRRLLGSGHI